jgi:hypothetical protein
MPALLWWKLIWNAAVLQANTACKALTHTQQRYAAEKQRAEAAEAALAAQLSASSNSEAQLLKQVEQMQAELAAQRDRVGQLEEEKASQWSSFNENCGASISSCGEHSGVSDDDDTVAPSRPLGRGLRRRDSATSLSYGDLASLSDKMGSRGGSPNGGKRRAQMAKAREVEQDNSTELSALRMGQVAALSELHAEMTGVVSGLERTTAKLMAAEGRILELQQVRWSTTFLSPRLTVSILCILSDWFRASLSVFVVVSALNAYSEYAKRAICAIHLCEVAFKRMYKYFIQPLFGPPKPKYGLFSDFGSRLDPILSCSCLIIKNMR